MKKHFHFTLNALNFLKIFKFLSRKTAWLEREVYFQILCHKLGNNCNKISKSKGNQKMKFGQLIKCDKRNIFYEISYTKCDKLWWTIPRLFCKNQTWAYFWIKALCSLFYTIESFMQFVFIVCHIQGYRNTLKLSCSFLRAHIKLFKKTKKRSESSFSCLIFFMIFEE